MSDNLHLFLLPAPDDPARDTPEYQAELHAFANALRAKRLEVFPMTLIRKSVGGASNYVGEFLVAFAAVGTPLATILGAWLQARYGRKVRLKIGDVEAEARTVEEVDGLLRRAQAFREKVEKDDKNQT
jgi:hypothetical protein